MQSLRFCAAVLFCGAFMVEAASSQSTTTAAKPAVALSPKAQECVTKLDPAGRMIFDASLSKMAPGKELRDVVKETTKALVKSGEVKRDAAKESAKAAGKCLRIDNK